MRSGQLQSDQGYVWLLSCGFSTSALVWWEKPGPWDSDLWIVRMIRSEHDDLRETKTKGVLPQGEKFSNHPVLDCW